VTRSGNWLISELWLLSLLWLLLQLLLLWCLCCDPWLSCGGCCGYCCVCGRGCWYPHDLNACELQPCACGSSPMQGCECHLPRPCSGNRERVLVRAGTSKKYIRKRKTYIVTTPLERLPSEKPPCSLNTMIAINDAVLRHPIFEDALRGRQLLNKQTLHHQKAHLIH